MKRVQRADGLRQLLIADRERSLQRWAVPGRRDEWLDDLRAHVPVVVSSAQLLCALMHAGLPYQQFAYGGADWGKSFVLDENDRLHTHAPVANLGRAEAGRIGLS
ncbi:hypothetical protein [Mycobacterium sp. 852002-51163_SCH5372311]|uniref:hypothetical protein n=1 Tax=Mycobacterium sp. 852002-51163_SCH5372311 TaxID=1834097 RepID=UPI000AD87109|nr:hypothetical protein [Mycobacterium sp. 852002-51163_SCH5372311]